MRVLLSLCLFLWPTLALAQDAPEVVKVQPTPSMVATILAFVVPLFYSLVKTFFADKQKVIFEKTHWAIGVAYGMTNNVAKFTATKVDDKIAFALGELRRLLEAQGIGLTPEIETQAKAAWGALHAEEKMRQQLALEVAGALPLDKASPETLRVTMSQLQARLDSMTLPSRP